MIKEITFSNAENKKKLLDNKFDEKIQAVMDKSKPEDKIIKFEGKIALINLKYDKSTVIQKTCTPPNYQEIKTNYIFKKSLYNYLTNGLTVKALNPKGKTKEFILKLSPDLMKVYLMKPKVPLVPPKIKYTIETPICTIVRGHGTDEFKKSGGKLFGKPPDKSLCFSIIQQKQEGEKKPKSLNIICTSEKEADKIYGAFEVGIYYAKSKCGKEEKGKMCERNKFIYSLVS